MPTDLRGWHPGERSIHSRLNYVEHVSGKFTWIENGLPDQHRIFHSNQLHFVPVTTLDAMGRPWSSLVAGASGEPGFISSPSDTELNMELKVWPGDPILGNLESSQGRLDGKTLVAGVGIEFPNRRRNKFAGWAIQFERKAGHILHLRLRVNQAIGNCPKYINVREFVTKPNPSPKVIYDNLQLNDTERLPEELIDLIHSSDTVFLGTSYEAVKGDKNKFPSHVGMNQRGGRPGFIRVVPSDGRTVMLPDYSGNRLMTSLGNIEATPLASMTFVSFETGDILYLTGIAKTLVDDEAQRLMPRQSVLTKVHITGYTFVRDALPVRQKPGSVAQRSPYSPPIRYLAEEKLHETTFDDVFVTLQSIEILSSTLATFTFETSQPVHIIPGQSAILDFTDFVGARDYQHMAFPGDEGSVNDDRIRTWTISSAHVEPNGTRTFSLTMRLKRGGLITGALFSIANQLQDKRPELLADTSVLELRVRLVGIGGEFVLPSAPRKLLWISGGIGITPFLSMLSSLSSSQETSNITFIVSTREPDVLLSLINHALPASHSGKLTINLFMFSDQPTPSIPLRSSIDVHYRRGRLPRSFLAEEAIDVDKSTAFVCGPPAFEEQVLKVLGEGGFMLDKVRREGFAY